MKLFGISIIALLGAVNFFLLIFQLLSGFHKIRVPMGVHRKTGLVLFIMATIHGLLGILASL